jgi:hypothetical protein
MKALERNGSEARSAESGDARAMSASASVAVDQHNGDREDNHEEDNVGQVELHEFFPPPG